MSSLQSHFERCALLSLEKREKLLFLAGEHFLQLDLDEGAARFNDDLTMPFQVLGTESENTLTWLWAWADEQAEVPEPIARSSREMRQWSEREGLTSLLLPSLDLDVADGTMLSIVAADVCGAGAFYRDHYEGGALFILLFSNDIGRQPDLDRAAFVRILGDLAAQYAFDHRNVIRSYFRSKGLPCSDADDTVNAQLSSGERVIIEFGDGSAVKTINGEPLV